MDPLGGLGYQPNAIIDADAACLFEKDGANRVLLLWLLPVVFPGLFYSRMPVTILSIYCYRLSRRGSRGTSLGKAFKA